MADFGDIPNNIAMAGSQSIRRNASDSAFEAFTPGAGAAAWGSITGLIGDQTDLTTQLDALQPLLVSGTNIKTINSISLLGSGDIAISATPGGSNGQIQFNDTSTFGGAAAMAYATSGTHLLITSQAAGNIPFAIRAHASQAGNLMELRNGVGTVNSSFNSTGGIFRIGTTSAALDANVAGGFGLALNTTGSTVLAAQSTAANGAGSGSFAIFYQNSGAALTSGTRMGGFLCGGWDGSATNRNGAGISAFAEGTWSTTSIPSYLLFETAPSGSATRSERLRIGSTGEITLNGSATAAAATNLLTLKASASHTGALTRWQNNSGTTQMSVAGNGRDWILDTTTGTKIGTATSQKLGFFNATPVVQQTGNMATALSNLGLVTSGTVLVGNITATGTPSGTTFLRGDGAWTTPSGAGDVSSNTATSVADEIALYADTTGKLIKRSTGTGVAKLTSGVLSASTIVTAEITNDAVTFAKIQDVGANSVLTRASTSSGDVGETALAASQLLGRGATGDVAAITLGTNLSMSGTTLNATGGGGTPKVTVLAMSNVASSVTGTTAETTLATYALPANTLPSNGTLRIIVLYSKTGTAGSLTPRIRFNGIGGTEYYNTATGTTQLSTQFAALIRANNSTSAQKGYPASSNTQVGNSTAAIVTSSVNTTSNVDIVLSGQLADSGDTGTLEGYIIEMLTP